jgi:hypothetical protein
MAWLTSPSSQWPHQNGKKAAFTPKSFEAFTERLKLLRLEHLPLILPTKWWDVTFWDHCLNADEAMMDLDWKIHSILLPNVEYHWSDFCLANGLSLEQPVSGRWRRCWPACCSALLV